MLLVDTNIFIEVLRAQQRMADCQTLLARSDVDYFISDLSLHSIGILLHRFGLLDAFPQFLRQVLPALTVLHLPLACYEEIPRTVGELRMDFEDAYQYHVARQYHLGIVTMDRDFTRVAHLIPVQLL